ncbi:uncharacterized protein N7446_011738 [Penicillium canescens]|uniref:Uncharacterized protein n=1 Tax=Penicillium canescens TaxID=5083 RepID=A0AAD6IG53_PENCN|nr:uncharacterized protein N7446_011738 [Penicillium canescens]KAJ6028922.1 hypothetical protein N7444_011909 [Penicillium canescens]KAJ6047356.1 hypothetical protein N7460_003503 [Penicillium canescens]KAJ6049055.1 hypothetical protein N7446_011738 [Penicillium canescens]
MSHFYPRVEYAEDQPMARTILATHVLSRGFQLGSAIGLLNSSIKALVKRLPFTLPVALHSAGLGGAIGAGTMGIGLIARMWGRDEIEWMDRSWRLLNNHGQVTIDHWSEAGAVLGAVAMVVIRSPGAGLAAWRGQIGGAGIGSLIGVGCGMCASRVLPQERE